MEENDFHCSAGDPGDAAVCLHRRRDRIALVELAAASALWFPPDQPLASAWASAALPHPVWRIGAPRWLRPLPFPSSHGRALRTHHAGRARTIPPTHARTLRLRPVRL